MTTPFDRSLRGRDTVLPGAQLRSHVNGGHR